MASSTLEILIEAVDNASKTIRGVSDAAKGIGKTMAGVGGMMSATVTAPIVAGLTLAAKSAIDFENSLSDIRKVAPFTDTVAGMERMKELTLQLTRDIPMSADSIASLISGGFKAGVAEADIAEYVKIAGTVSTAFEMTAEQTADAMNAIRAQFKLTVPEFGNAADLVNKLADSLTGAVEASDIVEILQRTGSVAKTAGLNIQETAAVGAAIKAAGASAEVSATGLKNFLLALSLGSKNSKDAKKSFRQLGLEASDVAERMQVDASGAMVDVLKRISQLDKAAQIGVMESIFGRESLGAIAPLLQNIDQLETALGMAGDRSQYAGSATAEFTAKSATTANQLKLLSNNVNEFAIRVGDAMLPAINQTLTQLMPLVQKMSDFAKANPEVTATLIKVALAIAAIGPALVAIGGVITAIGTIGTAIGAIGTAIGGAMAFLGPIVAGIGALFAGLSLPVLAVLAAMAALAVGVYYLATNFETVKTVIGNAFTAIGQRANQMALGIANAFLRMVSAAIAGASRVVSAITSMGSQIVAIVTGLGGRMFSAGAQMIQRLAAGIRSAVGAVTGAISAVTSRIAGFLPSSPVKYGELTKLNGGYSGGQIPSMVADGINRGSSTLTNAMASTTGAAAGAIGGGGGGGTPIASNSGVPSVTININGVSDPMAAGAEAERRFAALFARLQKQQARVSYS